VAFCGGEQLCCGTAMIRVARATWSVRRNIEYALQPLLSDLEDDFSYSVLIRN
jgi:hypothetical protein